MNKLYVKEVTLFDSFTLIRFFNKLDKDAETRKYYRYMYAHNALMKIIYAFLLIVKLTPIYKLLFRKQFIAIALFFNSRIIGLCHIDGDLRRKIGIYGIVIDRTFRGKGLGKLISHYIIRKAKKYVDQILLSVDYDNFRAIKLYKLLGFKPLKIIRHYDYRHVTREYVDVLVMIYKLK